MLIMFNFFKFIIFFILGLTISAFSIYFNKKEDIVNINNNNDYEDIKKEVNKINKNLDKLFEEALYIRKILFLLLLFVILGLIMIIFFIVIAIYFIISSFGTTCTSC